MVITHDHQHGEHMATKKKTTETTEIAHRKTTNLTKGDAQAALARDAENRPKVNLGSSFKTIPHHLPGRLRAIAISSESLRANQHVNPVTNMWPVIEIFDLPEDGNTMLAEPVEIEVDGYNREVFRHVEILGPSRVVHNPLLPLQGNGRRVAVMVTEAPLLVHVDSEEQAQRNGVTDTHVPNTVQEDRSARSTKQRFGC
jgi:hypothetical protein